VIFPKGFTHQSEFAAEVADVENLLKPQVVRIRHYFDDDASGEIAVFFLIVLSDEASELDTLRKTTSRIEEEIEQRIQPLRRWQVFPYFSYRSESEQAKMKSPAWAA
jgi:hypothetical protein